MEEREKRKAARQAGRKARKAIRGFIKSVKKGSFKDLDKKQKQALRELF